MSRTDLAAVLAVLVAGALVALAGAPPPEPSQAPRGRTVPVHHTTLTCPGPGVGDPASVAGAAASVPMPDAPRGPAAPARVRAEGSRLAVLDSRGAAWSGGDERIAAGVTVEADGPLAPALTTAVAVEYGGARRGLAVGPCREPAARWWFVGAASTPERSAVLRLANPTTGAAVVDVAVHGPDGPIPGARIGGLAVAADETRSLPLDDVAPGVDPLAVAVTARQGRVSAALYETARGVLEPAGFDLVPPTARPRRTSVLTGVARAGRHTLTVLNGGARPAVVDVEVLGEDGAFTPSALPTLRVPARAVASAPLPSRVLDGTDTGLRLTSDQPVAAAVRTTAGRPFADQSFATSAEAVQVLTATPVLPGLRGEVLVSAPRRRGAVAVVTTLDRRGRTVAEEARTLRPGQTRAVSLPARVGAVARLRTRGPGAVVAAVRWSDSDDDGVLVGGYPLEPLRLTVRRPGVRYLPVAP